MKKSLLILTALFLSAIGYSQTFTENYITYEVTSSTTVRTIGYNTAGGSDVTIPETVSFSSAVYDVTNIGPNCFSNKQLTSVSIPDSVTEIRSGAFQTNNLTTVTLPENVFNIQSWSFMNNPLTSIVSLGTTPPYIPNAGGNDAFDNRASIDLTIPFGTTGPYVTDVGAQWIGFNTVSDTPIFVIDYITYEVTSANTVRTIGYNTAGGSDVTIPDSVSYGSTVYDVTNIGPNCFSNKQLTTVSIPNSVTEIRSGAFQTNNLTTVIIPENVFNIQSWSFMNNPLTSIVSLGTTPPYIPNAGGNDAFDNRASIDLTIPFGTTGPYVTDVGAQWIGFNMVSDTPIFVIDYITYEVTSANTVRTIGYNTAGGSDVTIPSTVSYGSTVYDVTNIGPNCFSNKQLTTVSIPNSVTEIRSGAFQTNNLTTVTIPANVTNIQSWSFMSNPLTSIVSLNTTPPSIPNAGGNDAFDNRSNIDLTIPNGTTGSYVTDVGAKWTGFNTVTEALNLNDIFISNDATYLVTSTTTNTIEIVDYDVASGGTDLVIPATVTENSIAYNVTSIGNSSFYDMALTSVSIPNSITTIGTSAFNTNNLTSVTIPDSVTVIASQAFVTNDLTSLIIGDNVIEIAFGAFADNDLAAITIPASVTNIGLVAFAANPLTDVTSLATIPPTITTGTNDTFEITGDRSNIHLHIPAGTMGAYVTDSGALWTGFNPVTEDALSISDFELENTIKVITTIDTIKVIYSDSVRLENYTLYTITGAKASNGSKSEISTSTFAKGIYILKLDFDKGTLVKKVVIY